MKKQVLLAICAVTAISTMMLSCKKTNLPTTEEPTPDKPKAKIGLSAAGDNVYVGGFYFNSGNDVARYWLNTGAPTDLTLGTFASNGQVYDIEVSNTGTVVAIGKSNFYASRGTVWLNNSSTRYQLPTGGATSTEPRMVYINGNDVYIAGSVWGSTGGPRAAYWQFSLSSPSSITVNIIGPPLATTGSDAFGVTVAGGDVYVVGNNTAPQFATGPIVYWKNGVQTTLPGPVNSTRPQILNIGSDVYIAIVSNSPATIHLFKNGTPLTISGGPIQTVSAVSMATDGTKLSLASSGTDNPSAYYGTVWIWGDALVNSLPTTTIPGSASLPRNTSWNSASFGPSGNLFVAGRQGISTTAGGYWEISPAGTVVGFTSVFGGNNTVTGITVK